MPRLVRVAHRIDTLLTWGMQPSTRDDHLSERLADWEAMHTDHGGLRTALRVMRGIPAAIWVRLDAREITAVPAGAAMAALGLGGVAAGGLGMAYPTPLRLSIVTAGIGGLLLSFCLVTQPHRLVSRRYILPLLTMATGFIGMAIHVPSPGRWSDQQIAVESSVLDAALTLAFLTVGAGLVLLALVPATSDKRRLAHIAGTTVLVGLASFAITQVAWGLTVAPDDLTITIPSIGAALAAGSAAHLVPRLRHLEIL